MLGKFVDQFRFSTFCEKIIRIFDRLLINVFDIGAVNVNFFAALKSYVEPKTIFKQTFVVTFRSFRLYMGCKELDFAQCLNSKHM